MIVEKAPPEVVDEVPPDYKPDGENVVWIPDIGDLMMSERIVSGLVGSGLLQLAVGGFRVLE